MKNVKVLYPGRYKSAFRRELQQYKLQEPFADKGLKVGWYESLTKDPLNLVRRMTKQR